MTAKRWRCPECGKTKRTPPEVRETYHAECGRWLDLIETIGDDDAPIILFHAGSIAIEDRSASTAPVENDRLN